MFTYKGAKCIYLGVSRWRIIYKDWEVTLLARDGIREILEHIDHWEGRV